MELTGSPLFYPSKVMISKDHASGQRLLDRVTRPDVYDIDPSEFVEKRHSFALGGLQIVTGQTARLHGYCPCRREQTPVTDGCWRDTRGDVRFRTLLGTQGEAIDLPNVYRIREAVEHVCDVD
jgi:hypothetical protein